MMRGYELVMFVGLFNGNEIRRTGVFLLGDDHLDMDLDRTVIELYMMTTIPVFSNLLNIFELLIPVLTQTRTAAHKNTTT